jgi:flagellar hook-basal body complex protein FliE
LAISSTALSAAQAYTQAARAGAAGAGAPANSGFEAMLGDALGSALQSGRHAEGMAAQGLAKKAELVDVVTAVTQAELTLETVVAVRDKVIAAYQDIMRMPI